MTLVALCVLLHASSWFPNSYTDNNTSSKHSIVLSPFSPDLHSCMIKTITKSWCLKCKKDKWREDYLMGSEKKQLCWCFNCMLQLSSGWKWRSANKHYDLEPCTRSSYSYVTCRSIYDWNKIFDHQNTLVYWRCIRLVPCHTHLGLQEPMHFNHYTLCVWLSYIVLLGTFRGL